MAMCISAFCTSPMSKKNLAAVRRKMSGLTSGVFTLPLLQERAFRSARADMTHATIVAELAVLT